VTEKSPAELRAEGLQMIDESRVRNAAHRLEVQRALGSAYIQWKYCPRRYWRERGRLRRAFRAIEAEARRIYGGRLFQ